MIEQKNILVVEDNYLTRRLIKKVLEENNYHVYEASNTLSSLKLLQEQKIDLAILDINLGLDAQEGLNIGRELKEIYKIPFLYLTAYETHEIMQQALSTQPVSFITKPFKNVDLLAAITIALKPLAEDVQQFLTVKDADYYINVPVNQINYLESEGNYILVHLDDKMYKLRSTIKNIMDLLPSDQFIRIHRAFIVNKHKIEKYSHKSVVINNHHIPLSKNFVGQL